MTLPSKLPSCCQSTQPDVHHTPRPHATACCMHLHMPADVSQCPLGSKHVSRHSTASHAATVQHSLNDVQGLTQVQQGKQVRRISRWNPTRRTDTRHNIPPQTRHSAEHRAVGMHLFADPVTTLSCHTTASWKQRKDTTAAAVQ